MTQVRRGAPGFERKQIQVRYLDIKELLFLVNSTVLHFTPRTGWAGTPESFA